MQIRSAGQTDRGQVRQINEDAFFIDRVHQVYAVADGLGGLPGGADASRRIVELLDQTLRRVDAAAERVDLAELMIGIHRIVAREGQDAHPFTGAGSTLTVGQVDHDLLWLAHVGDSAAYLFRDGRLRKLTVDHTMEEEWIRRTGEAGRADMPPEYPHTLTRCVGQEDELRVDRSCVPLRPGDRLMFCTDGLNKVLGSSQLERRLARAGSPEALCQELIDAANAESGPDNITVILVFFD